MALPAQLYDHTAYAVSFNSVDCEDHTAEFNYNIERGLTDYPTFGGNLARAGVLKLSGEIRVPIDETAASPYETLLAELLTPTDGGIATVIRPLGAGSGNKEITGNVVIGSAPHGGAPADIQEAVFSFTMTTVPARAAQI